MLSAGSTAGRLLPPRERLREKAFEYCQRLAEQSTRRESRGRVPGCPWGTWGSLFFPGGLCVPDVDPGEPGSGQKLSPALPGICPNVSSAHGGRSLLPDGSPPSPRASRTVYPSFTVVTLTQTGGPSSFCRSPEEGGLRPTESCKCGTGGAHGAPRLHPSPPRVPASPQCLVEAVLVLDVLCRQDPSFLYRTLSCLKALHVRLCGDPARVRTLLPIAQFFLNHGEPPP